MPDHGNCGGNDTLNFRPGRFFGRQREVIRSLKPAWTWFRLSGCDVTPNLHPVPIRASASLLPTWAGEARGCVAYTSRRGIALGNQESMQATSPLTGVGTGPFFALHPFKALSQVSGGRAGLPQLGSGSGRGTLRQKSQAESRRNPHFLLTLYLHS